MDELKDAGLMSDRYTKEYERLGLSGEFKTIIDNANRFRTQVAENGRRSVESQSLEPGHRVAFELFLDGAVAFQKLGIDGFDNLVNMIDRRESDQDWVQGHRDKLGLTPEAISEARHQREKKLLGKRIIGEVKRVMGADTGVTRIGREA